ncbi:hypothetical protein D5F01_LYC23058 [Larimichthys crocea]|uniref:Ig-like domain-containing protein n=1 Tax=Larimichthys crocea TaxID=215358 RepID=A0A6G0HJP5_LARCR|nr:hypothetical protein D5F01_LYC23058 [Larimichthys crocea]
MKATAFFRLLMKVLAVQLAQVQNSYCAQDNGAAFLRVLPNRLQFFEYEFISFNCEFGGSAEWRVMRTLQEITPTNISNWETSAGSGTITPAFSLDSGEYWCEDGDGRRSNALNISVTAGSVILESPVHVTEGDHVTLKCQKKKDSGHLIAEFYKDGLRMKTIYEGNMTIFNVSASDEGFYKCYIFGAGESPESWLAVRGSFEDAHAGHSPNLLTLLSLLTLLLLVLGVCRKHKEPKVPKATTKPRLPEESAVYSTVYYRKRVL